MKVRASELKLFIAEALRAIINESRLTEKAPPGSEDKVMALKKSLRKQHPNWGNDKIVSVAIATAWKQHNKVNEAAVPPPVPAAAMTQKKPGTPPPLTPQQQKVKDQAAQAAYQKAIQAAIQTLGPLSPEDKKASWAAFVDKIEKEGPTQIKLPPMVEEETEIVEETTKVTVSELRTMIRNGLKEAFGLSGEDAPTGGFESENEKGKTRKSGTFGDGGEKKGTLDETIKISIKSLKEEIGKAIQEMMETEEGFEAPTVREKLDDEDNDIVSLEEGLWGYKVVDKATKNSILVKEEIDFPALARSFGWKGNLVSEAINFLDKNLQKEFKDPGYFERVNEGKKDLPPWLKKNKGKTKTDKKEEKNHKKGKEKKESEKKSSSKVDAMAKVRAAKKS